jgi:gas vesicle protein
VGARCLNNENFEEGKAKRTANNECQKEIAETSLRSQKALEEKKRLDARTVEKVATESEERVRKFVEQKRAREEKLAEEIKKLAPGRAGAGR